MPSYYIKEHFFPAVSIPFRTSLTSQIDCQIDYPNTNYLLLQTSPRDVWENDLFATQMRPYPTTFSPRNESKQGPQMRPQFNSQPAYFATLNTPLLSPRNAFATTALHAHLNLTLGLIQISLSISRCRHEGVAFLRKRWAIVMDWLRRDLHQRESYPIETSAGTLA